MENINYKNLNKMIEYIEFIKRLFGKKQPLLNKKNQKEDFINDTKKEDSKNDIVSLQIKLKQVTIEEENLNSNS